LDLPPARDTGTVRRTAKGWYWDLRRQRAVPASERGPGDQTLGPYPSKAEAENWKATVEERNEGWEQADEEWKQGPDADAH
jgi:hypothetical protein